MKKVFFLILIGFTIPFFAQKDSLQLGDRYAEDQLYMLISYNQLIDQPLSVDASGLSYGLSAGFIKDVTLNRRGSISLAMGLGYNFDLYNHGLVISEQNNEITFQAGNSFTSNKLLTHNLEFPLQLRWRNSDANTYKFWRIYMGIKASYNLSNDFKFLDETTSLSYKNIPQFNSWQYGVTLSVGYDVFTAHAYYGLNPILENAAIGSTEISSKILKIGLIFYLL